MPARMFLPASLPRRKPSGHDDRDQRDGDNEQDPDETVHLPLQRRAAPRAIRQGLRDPAELRPQAGGDDHSLTAPADDGRARIGQAVAIGQSRALGVRLRGRGLRQRLAGQRAPVEGQRLGPEQTQVGRHDVAGPQQNHVAGHQITGGHVLHLAVAPHAGERRRRFAQGFERLLAAVLGHDAGARRWEPGSPGPAGRRGPRRGPRPDKPATKSRTTNGSRAPSQSSLQTEVLWSASSSFGPNSSRAGRGLFW